MKMHYFYFMILPMQAIAMAAADWTSLELHDAELKEPWVQELKEQIYTLPSQPFDHLTLYQLSTHQLESVRWTYLFCKEALIDEEKLTKGDPFTEEVFKEFNAIQAVLATMPEPEDGSHKGQRYVLQEAESPYQCSPVRVQALQMVSLSTCPEWGYVESLKEKMNSRESQAKELFMQQERQRIDAIGNSIEEVYRWRLGGERLDDSLRAKYGWWAKKS